MTVKKPTFLQLFATFGTVEASILQTRSNNMLSRSKGQHKITFQQLPRLLNPKVIKNLIIGIGLISSLIALLMILEFVGLKQDYLQVMDISN